MVFVNQLTPDIQAELIATAQAIIAPGKGILASDESTGTIKKRFDGAAIENTIENRAAYRSLLYKTPKIGDYISGAIMFEETLYQKNAAGESMVDLCKAAGIIPGIKVDKGVVTLNNGTEETATQGLDGLGARCEEYYKAGARFAKWRSVLRINRSKSYPSQESIVETAHTLARYAAICQANRLVPIVEPEILTDGDHDISVSEEETTRVLAEVFKALNDQGILLEGCLLKPNMVTHGVNCAKKATPQEIGAATLRALQRSVPPSLVGVCFLSGGMSEEESSVYLNAMNSIPTTRKPWALTFSYGRALQATCIKTWAGKAENEKAAQDVLFHRAKSSGLASIGKYVASGATGSGESLHVSNYSY